MEKEHTSHGKRNVLRNAQPLTKKKKTYILKLYRNVPDKNTHREIPFLTVG